LLLSLASTILQPFQQKNLEIEKMKDILGAANIKGNTNDIPDYYNKYVVEEIVIDLKGNILSSYKDDKFVKGNVRAFNVDLKQQNKIIKEKGEGMLSLFVVEIDSNVFYVIPMLGKGLWGPVWGNIAIKEDFSSVVGVVFGHKSETPGLGAEISSDDFQKQFFNKKIFSEMGEFVSISVVKGGVKNSNKVSEINGVDAITGGTITSDGVNEMLYSTLKNYIPYFEKNKK
jgi:Na+-transporting NADH:ubiquinone oxidoreductase subunit C